MFIKKRLGALFGVLLCLNFTHIMAAYSLEAVKTKYPDYANEFVGEDKCENFNRKIFNFNSKLNKCLIKPVHVIWSSIMPKYGMDKLQNAYINIEYPKRLVSSLIQKDFKTTKSETVRFLTNSTIGLGGLFDPAKKYLKIEHREEDIEQALTKCNVKQGPYIVIPIMSSTSPRGIAGKIFDAALNPTSYVGTPVVAFVKFGLVVNKTSYIQPLYKMVESNYADPYEIIKKLYGLENYIKTSNYDRKEFLDETVKKMDENSVAINPDNISIENSENLHPIQDFNNNKIKEDKVAITEFEKENTLLDTIYKENTTSTESPTADIIFSDYNPQNPVVDSMRTALFDLPNINNSPWNELSVWNRTFAKKIKTSHVNIDPTRADYKFRYILQKNKNSPVAIVYPSTGEGIMSYHSVVLAKMFYDEGYSVIIQGSHFQWEFVKSMPVSYKPGYPKQDAQYLKAVTVKILNSLEEKNNCKFGNKVVIGTSFGAMSALFLGDSEYEHNTLGNVKYISINPPIELMYAMEQIDKNSEEWNKNAADIKNKVAITAAKVIQTSQLKNEGAQIKTMPFAQDEAKLITGFIMHQKLSDVIFTIENGSKTHKSDIYKTINNTNYSDYTKKYFKNEFEKDFNYETSLHSISNYLKNCDNYKIYHALDDYLVNSKQLKQLEEYSGGKAVYMNNGSHLGFLYRQEFIDELRKEISLKQVEEKAVENNI